MVFPGLRPGTDRSWQETPARWSRVQEPATGILRRRAMTQADAKQRLERERRCSGIRPSSRSRTETADVLVSGPAPPGSRTQSERPPSSHTRLRLSCHSRLVGAAETYGPPPGVHTLCLPPASAPLAPRLTTPELFSRPAGRRGPRKEALGAEGEVVGGRGRRRQAERSFKAGSPPGSDRPPPVGRNRTPKRFRTLLTLEIG